MRAPVSRLRRTLYVLAAVGAVTALIGACSSDRPDGVGATSSSSGGTTQDLCGTPHEGCECIEPGAIVECGEVKNVSSDGFVQCSMGTRQCLGGAWGKCFGETDVRTKSYMASSLTGTLALGSPAKCGAVGGGPADPCDPYCNAFVDDPLGLSPEGGLVVLDGSLTIPPNEAGTDGGAPGVFQSVNGGKVTCGGATNITGPACTPPGLTTCQQDFRCDASTNTCQWNGGPGYWDATAGGPDLTLGAPCGAGGAGVASAPVCNRGSVAVPSGSTIGLNITATLPSGCTNLGGAQIAYVLSAPLGLGECVTIPIGNSAGNKFITVNAGSPGPIVEGPGRCANNSAPLKDDGTPGCGTCGSCSTTLTGKVFDPSGPLPGGNGLPLPGVTVFQPVGPLPAFADGVACESCASLDQPAVAKAVTDATGSFVLTGVSPGPNVPIVVQSGRWRRKVTLSTPITACQNNTGGGDGTFRMPRNRTDGDSGKADIPRTALVMSDNESLECLLVKMGVSTSEFGAYSAGAPQRIRLFRNNGLNYPGVPAAVPGVFNALNEHTQTIFDCDGAGVYNTSPLWNSTSGAQKSALQTYAANGGKVFLDHLPGQLFLSTGPSPFNTVSSWNNTLYQETGLSIPAKGQVLSTTPEQTVLRKWLNNVNAMTDYGAPYLKSDVPRRHSLSPAPGLTTTWVRGETANNWGADPGGNYALSFSFEMGVTGGAPTVNANCGIADAHGRVMFNGMHVSQSRAPYPATGAFPGVCVLGFALTPEEKALEFQLFQLTACALGGAPPPPPPTPPPPLTTAYFTRDYKAACGVGEKVKWGPFYWEGVFVPGTSIDFRAATASSVAALPASPPPGAPTTAAVGSTGTSVIAPAWDCNGCPGAPVTVDSELKADTGSGSNDYLRIYMKFNPTAILSPILTSWRQVYDCVPSE